MAFLAASGAGLALVPAIVLQPNLPHFQDSMTGLVGALYIGTCVLGTIAVFYPAKCRSLFQKSQNPISLSNKPATLMQVRGHHPDCKKFSANRIHILGCTLCASCSGLLIGAAISVVGAILYFAVGFGIAWGNIWLIVLGETFMLLGLAQIKFAGYVKVFANLVFVVGSFVTLVEADMLGGSMLVDFYVLGLIAFVLWLRILLSEWNNTRTCQACQSCFQ